MEKHLRMQDVPTEIAKMDMDEVEAGIPEMKLRRLIAELQRRLDSLLEQGIEDKDLADKIKMMEVQLGMLEAQKRQALEGGMGQPPPTGQPPTGGVPVRSPVPGVP